MTRRHAALLACFIVVLANVAIAGEKVYVDCQGKLEVPAYSAPDKFEPIGNLVCGQEVYSMGKAGRYTKIALPGNQYVYVISSFIVALDQAHLSQEITGGSTRYAPEAAHTSTETLIVRSRVTWREGMEGADKYCNDGEIIESLTVNGLTVSVSLRDTGWKMRSDVVITNNTDQCVDVHPERFFVEVPGSKPKQLDYESPERLTKSVNRRAQQAAFGIGLRRADATNIIPTDSSPLGPFKRDMEFDTDSNSKTGRSNRSCRGSTPSTTAVPDCSARRKADADTRAALQTAAQASGDPSQIVLRTNTIMPAQQISGAVYFERYKGKSPVILKIPLRGTVIEFPF